MNDPKTEEKAVKPGFWPHTPGQSDPLPRQPDPLKPESGEGEDDDDKKRERKTAHAKSAPQRKVGVKARRK